MKVRPERDVWALAEAPAPPDPLPGMHLWVTTGATWRDGYPARVADVSDSHVAVRRRGRVERFPRGEWTRWLLERTREGPVQIDGHPMMPPPEGSTAMDLDARDARIFRAVRDVLRGYRIGPAVTAGPGQGPGEPDGLVAYQVSKPGQAPYTVKLDPRWRFGPQCSCPDWLRVRDGDRGGYCKHVVAVLLQSDEFRHQLVELLL